MNYLPEPRPTFPDDNGADVFVRELRNAVVPSDRNELRSAPPPVLLCVPSDDERGRRRNRVLAALRYALGPEAKLVPCGVVSPSEDTESLTEAAAAELAFNHPGHQTPNRLPGFALVRDILHKVRQAQNGGQCDARSLRDAAYADRVHRGGLPAALWRFGGPVQPPAGLGWLMQYVMEPLFRTFPRWWWARRQTRRLVTKGWLGQELGSTSDGLFALMEHEATLQLPRLRLPEGHPRREEVLTRVEAVLLRALLEDLRHPQVGKGTPRRRRRTARPVLLVELPPEDTPGAAAAHRFLRVLHQLRQVPHQLHQHVPGPGPLVIAVGSCPESLLAELGSPEPENLRVVGHKVHGSDPQPVFAKLAEEPFGRGGIPVQPVRPDTYRASARTASVTVGAAATAAVVALGGTTYFTLGPGAEDPPSTACVGDSSSKASSDVTKSVAVQSKKWYADATERIITQNNDAEKYATNRNRIRTVVHFISSAPTGQDEADEASLFDGVIPELRGIAMWQKKLNSDAGADPARVMLRVEVRTTGPGFQNAVRKAEELVKEVKEAEATKKKPGERSQEIVGVVGFAQSKEETLDALKVLGDAGIPVVGTTATANEMRGDTYWPSTPKNSDETRIAAAFAEKENIVGRKGKTDECAPARHAVIVETASDLYSHDLAEGFRDRFQGTETTFNFNQQNSGSEVGNSIGIRVDRASTLANHVCEEQTKHADTVVYWTGRAQEFTAFVQSYDGTSCAEKALTVLGGNDLTNVALTEKIRGVTWLRLYYTAHRLPLDDTRASVQTKKFDGEYEKFMSEAGTDPWSEDGHAAVAYDALQVLSRAMDNAYSAGSLNANGIRVALGSGIAFEGATGSIHYTSDSHEPPDDKTLVILRQQEGAPKAVAVCGAYDKGEKSEEQGPPCSS